MCGMRTPRGAPRDTSGKESGRNTLGAGHTPETALRNEPQPAAGARARLEALFVTTDIAVEVVFKEYTNKLPTGGQSLSRVFGTETI